MAETKTLNQQLIEAQKTLSDATGKHRTASLNATKYSNQYNQLKRRRDGGECAQKYSRRPKRQECQNALNAQTASAYASLTTWISKRDSEKARMTQAEGLISSLEEQIDSRIENSSTLAEKGLTSEAVETSSIITAKAQAQSIREQGSASSEAIKAKAVVEAEAQAESAETKNKMTIIIGSVLALIIVIAGAIALKKFKNKK